LKVINNDKIGLKLQILEFELKPEDMKELEALDKGEIARSCFGLPG